MAGRFRMGPPPRFTRAAACAPPPRPPWEPALPRPRPPPRPPRWLRFSLMMSSRDMSILSAMAGAESALARARASARRRVTSGAAQCLPVPSPWGGRGLAASGWWGRGDACALGSEFGGRCCKVPGSGRGRFYTFPRGRCQRKAGGAARG